MRLPISVWLFPLSQPLIFTHTNYDHYYCYHNYDLLAPGFLYCSPK